MAECLAQEIGGSLPRLTPSSGDGYADPEFVEMLQHLGAESTRGQIGYRIVEWLARQTGRQGLAVHATFAGGGASELGMAAHPAVASLVLSDSSEASVRLLQDKIRTLPPDQAEKCRVERRAFPLPSSASVPTEEVDLVTCLGVSLLHVPTSQARLRCLRQFRDLCAAGGYLFIDNKNWAAGLVEGRDPITLYPLPAAGGRERYLAVTYEYPWPGRQIYHAQLLQLDRPGPRQPLETERRWTIEAFPFTTAALLEELSGADFDVLDVVDEAAWPASRGDGRAAYYQLVIARTGTSPVSA